MNIYRCDMDTSSPKYFSARNAREVAKSLDCGFCMMSEKGKCRGAVLVEGAETPGKNGKNGKNGKAVNPAEKKPKKESPKGPPKEPPALKAPPAPGPFPFPDIPGFTPETDAAIRAELKELAEKSPIDPRHSDARELLDLYGDLIKTSRGKGHGWEKLCRIFRRHGFHVGMHGFKKLLEDREDRENRKN
jgi:hypothetical protein